MSEVRWVSLAELHVATGLAVRTLQYIAAREPGVLVTRRRRSKLEYKLPDCAINLRQRAVKQAQHESDPTSFEEARTRKETALARQEELKLARLRRDFAPCLVIGDLLRTVLEPVSARLSALPGRVAPQLMGLERPAVARDIVFDAIRETLQQIQRDADQAQASLERPLGAVGD